MAGVLAGTRVLDFGRYIAGPFCATMLADMGADVIRIERVDGSEDRYIASVCDSGEGGPFLQMGRNKRGLTLNPMKPEGREIISRLVPTADVVVANLPGSTLREMGIDYATLKRLKPDIILTHITAFGSHGPYAERIGFDLLGQAMSGMAYLSGTVDGPVRSQVPYVDYSTALFAAFGTVAALMERRKSGRGQVVEASLLWSSLALNNSFLIEEGVLRLGREPHGNRGHHHAPNDLFKTRDGWVFAMVAGNPIFERWARLMGEDEWLQDPRFASDLLRGRHGQIISERMARWCIERTTEQAVRAMEEARIPAGRLYKPAEVLSDPHVQACGIFKAVDYPGLPRPAPLVDTPVRLSATPGGIRQRAPRLGEHTDEIMRELGYGMDEMEALSRKRVI